MSSSVGDYDTMWVAPGRCYLGVSEPPEFFSPFVVFILGDTRGCPTRSDNISASDGLFASLKDTQNTIEDPLEECTTAFTRYWFYSGNIFEFFYAAH